MEVINFYNKDGDYTWCWAVKSHAMVARDQCLRPSRGMRSHGYSMGKPPRAVRSVLSVKRHSRGETEETLYCSYKVLEVLYYIGLYTANDGLGMYSYEHPKVRGEVCCPSQYRFRP